MPQQAWDRTWTDEDLYKKYKLTQEDIAFIESRIKPMMADAAAEPSGGEGAGDE